MTEGLTITSQEFSYNFDNEANSSFKIELYFNIKDAKAKIDRKLMFKIDTGARDIAVHARQLGITISEEEFAKQYNVQQVKRYGIARKQVIYYRYIVDSISLGSITLYKFPIFITFQENAVSKLIGMSFLRLFNITIRPDYKLIKFKATDQTEQAIKNNTPMTDVETKWHTTYIDFDEQALEAHRINKLYS